MFFDSILLNALVIIVLLVSLTFDYVTKFFKYWYVRHIPYKVPIPFFGSDYHRVLALRSTTEEVNTLCVRFKKDKLIGCFKSRIPDLIVKDPEILKTILSTEFKSFSSRGIGLDKCRHVCLRNNLFYADGEKWTLLRERLVKLLNNMDFKFEEHDNCLFGINGEVNVQQLMANVLDNIFTQILIDSYSNSEEESVLTNLRSIATKRSLSNKFSSYVKNIFPSVYVLVDLLMNRKTSPDKTNKVLENSKLLKEIRSIFTRNTLNVKEKSKLTLDPTMDYASSVLSTFVVEGILPCQFALTALFYELSLNPQIQHAARVSLKSDQDNYLENIIKETLRLHPPFSVITRKCGKMYRFLEKDFLVDRGVTLNVPIESLHLDESFYKEPKTFNPDRFSQSEKPLDSFNYLPFGEGQRKCPGEELSLRIISSVTKVILQNYVIESTEKTPPQLPAIDHNFGRLIDGDLWLKFTKLNDSPLSN